LKDYREDKQDLVCNEKVTETHVAAATNY